MNRMARNMSKNDLFDEHARRYVTSPSKTTVLLTSANAFEITLFNAFFAAFSPYTYANSPPDPKIVISNNIPTSQMSKVLFCKYLECGVAQAMNGRMAAIARIDGGERGKNVTAAFV